MNPIEFDYLQKLAQQTKSGHAYLSEWNNLNERERKESMEQNREFWNDLFDDSPLVEDAVPTVSPNINTNSQLPKILTSNK